MATKADERRWREAMEKLGVATVLAKLEYGHADRDLDAEVRGIVDEPPSPRRRFVEAWLAKKDKHRARMDFWTWVYAGIAAATGIVAVGLGIAGLLR